MCSNNPGSMKLTQIFVFLGLLCNFVTCRECSEEVIDECLKPIAQFDTEINSAVVIYLEEPVLREHCRLYEQFSQCMDDVRPNCGTVDRLIFEGIDDSYHYLCEEKIDDYLKHRKCFANEELHGEGNHCNYTLTKKLDSIDASKSVTYRRDRLCQYAEDYLDCVQNAVESFCGAEAGDWQRGMDERGLYPILREINCPFFSHSNWWRDQSGNGSIISILSIVVVVVILVFGALIVILCRVYHNKKSRREARADRVANQDGPYVSYNNGVAMVMSPPGQQDGANGDAGALPDKGPLPPPYTPGPFPDAGMMPEAGATGVLPPAYSDIGDEKSHAVTMSNPDPNGYEQPLSESQASNPYTNLALSNQRGGDLNPMYDNTQTHQRY